MEKSIAKNDTIYTRQRDRGKTNLSQPKLKTLSRDIISQRWLITSSNLSTITWTHSMTQTSNFIFMVCVLLNLLQHMLSFKLLALNSPFTHDFLELGLMAPIVFEDQIVSFIPNGSHSTPLSKVHKELNFLTLLGRHLMNKHCSNFITFSDF